MVPDVTASVNAFIGSHRLAAAEIPHLSLDDPFSPILTAFIAKTSPRIEKLKQLHHDLLAELSSVLAYFAEKPDSSVEQVFTTILTFGFSLQKAAAEMSKLTPNIPTRRIVPTGPVSQTSEGKDDKTPTGTVVVGATDVPKAALGTLTRGEFDEAIRTIHGGARRRDRREASMASSIAGSIRLNRMLLDGSKTGARLGTSRKPSGGHKRLASVFQQGDL